MGCASSQSIIDPSQRVANKKACSRNPQQLPNLTKSNSRNLSTFSFEIKKVAGGSFIETVQRKQDLEFVLLPSTSVVSDPNSLSTRGPKSVSSEERDSKEGFEALSQEEAKSDSSTELHHISMDRVFKTSKPKTTFSETDGLKRVPNICSSENEGSDFDYHSDNTQNNPDEAFSSDSSPFWKDRPEGFASSRTFPPRKREFKRLNSISERSSVFEESISSVQDF